MIKIRELIKTEVFSKMRIVGETIWYDNEIDSIGIFEYEAIENQYDLFRKGDFVLTTLMFAKDDPNYAETSLIRLMKQRISAIAIKDIYFKSVSPKVQAYAERHKIQIMFFDEIPFEDIIVTVSEEIKNKELIKYYEARIDELMNELPENEEVISIVNDINSSFLNGSHCAYAVPTIQGPKKQKQLVDSVMQNVRSRKNKGANSIHNSIFRYNKGIFIIHTFDPNITKNGYLEELMNSIGLTNKFNVGIGNIHKKKFEIKYGVKEAIISYNKNKTLRCFDDLGVDRFILPLSETYWAETYKKKIINPIIEYDKDSSYKLLETAIKFVQYNGELKNTSEALGQHVNTIRYRLNKIRQLMNCPKENSDFYEQLFIAVKLYLSK
jgi:hypothetical protein